MKSEENLLDIMIQSRQIQSELNTLWLKKNVSTYFLLCVGQIRMRVLEETFNKTMQKVPISPKICASTTLGNLKWQTEPSTQYLHVHFNKSLNSYKNDWQLLSQKSLNI